MPTWSVLKIFTLKNLVSHFEKSNNIKTANKMLTDFWRPEKTFCNVHHQPTVLQQSTQPIWNSCFVALNVFPVNRVINHFMPKWSKFYSQPEIIFRMTHIQFHTFNLKKINRKTLKTTKIHNWTIKITATHKEHSPTSVSH